MKIEWLWKLTRSRYGRAVYDALAALGIKVSLMYLHTRNLHDIGDGGDEGGFVPDGVSLSVQRLDEIDADTVFDGEIERGDPADTVILARSAGSVVGYTFLSTRPVYVDVLETEVGDADTAHIWKLHVDPAHRQKGIGTALVDRACRVATKRGMSRVSALIALDNSPSQALSRTADSERQALLVYVRLFSFSHRVRWQL